jgi:transposase InsO family protein
LSKDPTHYHKIRDNESDLHQLICYTKEPGDPWKICLPEQVLARVVQWYHNVLVHTGETRMNQTIALHFYHPRLWTHIQETVKNCVKCQKNKNSNKAYGKLPERVAEVAPWQTVAVDLIGPWDVHIPGRILSFHALTVIDTVTNFPEIIRVQNKMPSHVAHHFRNVWLCRYPKPETCISDQGGEFLGREFRQMLARYNIRLQIITAKNPQGNSIVERLHQTMGNSIRTLLDGANPQSESEANALIDSVLQTAAYAARAAIHTTLGTTPGAIAFQRDMILNIPLIADFKLLQEKRQLRINENLQRMNSRRITHDYQPGDKVWTRIHRPTKLQPRYTGPFTILRVHTNGTVTIKRDNVTSERINIRRIKPYTTEG